MRIDIITVLPELLQSPLNHSIIKRAQDKGLVELVVQIYVIILPTNVIVGWMIMRLDLVLVW